MIEAMEYYTDYTGIIWRYRSNADVAAMWQPIVKEWSAEFTLDQWNNSLGGDYIASWKLYLGDMPEGSIVVEKHECVFPLANAFTTWSGTWGCPVCLTVYSWIKGFDDGGIWLDWTNHGSVELLTNFIK